MAHYGIVLRNSQTRRHSINDGSVEQTESKSYRRLWLETGLYRIQRLYTNVEFNNIRGLSNVTQRDCYISCTHQNEFDQERSLG